MPTTKNTSKGARVTQRQVSEKIDKGHVQILAKLIGIEGALADIKGYVVSTFWMICVVGGFLLIGDIATRYFEDVPAKQTDNRQRPANAGNPGGGTVGHPRTTGDSPRKTPPNGGS